MDCNAGADTAVSSLEGKFHATSSDEVSEGLYRDEPVTMAVFCASGKFPCVDRTVPFVCDDPFTVMLLSGRTMIFS